MADPEPLKQWPSEDIPDACRLLLRVHVDLVPDLELGPNVFREHGGSMSTDWGKYSTPHETRARTGRASKNGVVSLLAETVRTIDGLGIKHEPDEERQNRAHAGVYGIDAPSGSGDLTDKKRRTRIRFELFKICAGWLIDPRERVRT
jgi:hypothetical protein